MYNDLINVQHITINNITPELVDEYIYLKKFTHKSDSLLPGINKKIVLTWKAFRRNSIIFKSRIPLYLKKNTFDQCILPVITYECET